MGGADADREITDKFSGELRALKFGEREHWIKDRDGLLAYVILADQFSRNIFRGDAISFSFDEKAVKAARLAHDPSRWVDYKSQERVFLIMPLMHVEDASVTQEGIGAYIGLLAELRQEFGAESQPYKSVTKNY